MKVFLVEDSPILRERLEGLLASIPGAQPVGHAATAEAAIAGIAGAGPDVVVLDIHLEEGNGFDVMKAVGATRPEVRFYVITNYPNEAYRRKARELGAAGFFDKSSEFSGLREVLMKASG